MVGGLVTLQINDTFQSFIGFLRFIVFCPFKLHLAVKSAVITMQ